MGSTSTSESIAYAAGAITITGSFLGMEYQMLFAGLFGGLVALSYFPQLTRLRMAASVFASALLAGYGAPVIAPLCAGLLNKHVDIVHDIDSASLKPLMAFLIGISAQALIPLALARLRKLGIYGGGMDK